jgi:hypothetical protein
MLTESSTAPTVTATVPETDEPTLGLVIARTGGVVSRLLQEARRSARVTRIKRCFMGLLEVKRV